MSDLKENSMVVLDLAVRIADRAVRSDVELYAHGFEDDAQHPVYDTTRQQELGGSPEDLHVVAQAMRYIEARGDRFPWLMKRQMGATHLVRFVDKSKDDDDVVDAEFFEGAGDAAPQANTREPLFTSDEKILWGIVANAGRLSNKRQARWVHVYEATGLGSTSAATLCRRFGFDPDKVVGGKERSNG